MLQPETDGSWRYNFYAGLAEVGDSEKVKGTSLSLAEAHLNVEVRREQ
jgi:hypothetical protein